jgi:DNA uptake protein ComE-like DNA-binding protein
MKFPRLPIPQPWNASQRVVLIGLTLALAAYVVIRHRLNPMFVSDPQPLAPSRASELADRIDPNTATADELSALPLIGDRRARDIIAYRQRYVAEHNGQAAFREPQDLLAIRGIGAAILAQMRPFLIFPKELRSTSGETSASKAS